jgi:hypothetical protein
MMFALATDAGAQLLCGCGGGEAEQPTPAGQSAGTAAEQAAPPAPEHPTEHPAATAVATHDCDGGCGMTAVPEDQLTQIDGKWYCAACAKKVQEGQTGHGAG